MLRNPTGLSRAVVALLAVNIVFDVVLGLIDVHALAAGTTSDLNPAMVGGLDLSPLYGVSSLVFLATAVVFIVWFHRLRRNTEVWAPDTHSRGVGWAIGGWFIPIGTLWIPRGVATDIWRASRPDAYAADGRGDFTLINFWWTFWIAGSLADQVSARLSRAADTADGYVTATQWSLAGDGLDVVAAVLAILVVRRLTSMQHAKATGMIPAAQ
ncbi:DUF4328 domain-containing protein [Streptomyces sp. NPDC004788]